jgi:predicted nuclease of predicted toxin-antitoxin system
MRSRCVTSGGSRRATNRSSTRRAAGAAVTTKDADFVALQERLGAPPQIIWLTCGNTSKARLHTRLEACWPRAQELLLAGERLVEIGEAKRNS